MGRNTSVSLGDYFEEFVDNRVTEGRFKNASVSDCLPSTRIPSRENEHEPRDCRSRSELLLDAWFELQRRYR